MYQPQLFSFRLKTAKVVPLPKAKDLTDINNYRPISVLSSISKPLEKHVHKHLLKYLDRFNLSLHISQDFDHNTHVSQHLPVLLTGYYPP